MNNLDRRADQCSPPVSFFSDGTLESTCVLRGVVMGRKKSVIGGHVGIEYESDGLPSQAVLFQLFELGTTDGAVDGRLIHKPRPVEWFASEWSWRMWNDQFAGQPAIASPGHDGRGQGTILNKPVKAHRIVYKMVHGGLCPEQLDHKDGNPQNNRPDNLRPATTVVNLRNRRRLRNNKSGVCGVSFNTALGKWTVSIGDGKRNKYLGRFATLEEAVAVRKAAEKEYGYSERHGTPAQPPPADRPAS